MSKSRKNIYQDDIIRLRSEGYTYRQIVAKLGCNISTVQRYCNPTYFKDHVERWRRENNVSVRIYHKLDNFQNKRWTARGKPITSISKEHPTEKTTFITPVRSRASQKIQGFVGNKYGKSHMATQKKKTPTTFGIKEIEAKFKADERCYLSGRKIEWEKTTEWHLDHITARSKGGSNTLDNCGIACKEANIAKSNLSVESLLKLCEDILTHNGATVKW